MSLKKSVIISALTVFAACVPYAQGTTYVILTASHVNENRDCSTRFSILREGIDDSFHVSCMAGLNTGMYMDGDSLLIGNYRDNRVSVYVEGSSSLVMLSGDHRRRNCQRKTFHDGRIISQVNMATDECDIVKAKVDKATNNNMPLVQLSDMTLPQGQEDACSGTITILGEEIRFFDDTADCKGVEGVTSVFVPNGFVVSNYHKDHPGEILFSDKPRMLIRISEAKTCEKILFAAEYGKWDVSHSHHMSERDCATTMKNVEDYLGFTIYRYSFFRGNRCDQEIIINGRQVAEALVLPCDDAARMRAAYRDGWLLLGNPEEDETSAFSDNAGTLVVMRSDSCTKYIFDGERKLDRNVPNDECQEIKYLMKTTWSEIDQGAPTGAVREFKITRQLTYTNDDGKCIENIDLEGHGFKDVIHASCDTGKRLRLSVIQNGFILCDHQRRRLCVVVDSPKTVISVRMRRECGKLTYDNGVEKKSTASVEECDAAREKVQIAKAATVG